MNFPVAATLFFAAFTIFIAWAAYEQSGSLAQVVL